MCEIIKRKGCTQNSVCPFLLPRGKESTSIMLKNQPWDDRMNIIYKKEEDTGNESKRGI